MLTGRWAFGLLVAATLAADAALVFWAAPRISAQAGGLPIFDLRLHGYDFAAAQAFLTALSGSGRAFYLGTAQQIDTVFPALVAVSLLVALWRLSRGWLRLLAVALPLGAMAFDYLENARVAAMLRADPGEVSAAMVAVASDATVAKFALLAASLALLLGLLVWRSVR